MKFQIFIFSFNRGLHLANCLLSTLDKMPKNTEVFIMDDNSDNALTRFYLNLFKYIPNVFVFYSDTNSYNYIHGGLLYLQNQSIKLMRKDYYSIFLQDDMQIIRKITNSDIYAIQTIFSNSKSPFLYINFLKNSQKVFFDNTVYFFVNSYGHYEKIGFSDVCMINNNNLINSGFVFSEGENYNAIKAYNEFGPMPVFVNPITAYLPQPPTYRNSSKEHTLITKLYSKFRTGFFPLELSKNINLNNFLIRDPSEFPYADDFLDVDPEFLNKNQKVKKPYIYNLYGRRNIFDKIMFRIIHPFLRIFKK